VIIAVDLRCLNYPVYTGVNVYVLHLLDVLKNLKNNQKNLEFVAIGIKKERIGALEKEFPFLKNLFTSKISLSEYLNYPKWFRNYKILNLWLLIRLKLTKNIFSQTIQCFDYLILPQPKPVLMNKKTKLISVFHDLFAALDRSGLSFSQKFLEDSEIYKQLCNTSSVILVNSISTGEDLKNFLLKEGPKNQIQEYGLGSSKSLKTVSKIKLVYPSLPNISSFRGDSEFLSSKSENLPKDNYYLAISGIEHRKNWHNLLLAHRFLQVNYPDFSLKLILAGTIVNLNYYKELVHLIEKYSIKNVIWFLKPNDRTKNDLIQNCLFLVYPSFYEGFGFPILEALEKDKAVVTSRISSMPEIAKDSAIYINPFNLKDLATGVYLLFKDKNFRLKLESNSKKNLNNFSWKEMYEFFEKTFK